MPQGLDPPVDRNSFLPWQTRQTAVEIQLRECNMTRLVARGNALERAEGFLLAPVERVAGWDTVMPYPRLEHHYMPSVERIVAAARRTLAYT